MKKNRCPKLTLHRETLSVLDRPAELADVVGGATGPRSVCGTCVYDSCYTCGAISFCTGCN